MQYSNRSKPNSPWIAKNTRNIRFTPTKLQFYLKNNLNELEQDERYYKNSSNDKNNEINSSPNYK